MTEQAVTARETDRLVRTFEFTAREFAGESDLYARLARLLAAAPRLGEPLLAAPQGQRRALLLFASIAQVLRTIEPEHPLADWYPSLGGTRQPDDPGLATAFESLLTTYRTELTSMCASRTTQTNEVRRAALIRPALGFATAQVSRPLALVELGTSAGLLLVPDRYTYRYTSSGRTETYGTGFEVECDVRRGWPDSAGVELNIASRVGIDLNPILPGDRDAVNWLRACIWPEHVDRVTRLDAALAVVAHEAPPMVAGNFVDVLPGVLDAIGPEAVPCVFTSHALAYLRTTERASLLRLWHTIGQHRDLVVIINENAVVGVHAFAPDAVVESDLRTPITAVVWRHGRPSVTVLAHGGPHGNYLYCESREYAYAPPLLARH